MDRKGAWLRDVKKGIVKIQERLPGAVYLKSDGMIIIREAGAAGI